MELSALQNMPLSKAVNELATNHEVPRVTPAQFVALLKGRENQFTAACLEINRAGVNTPMLEHAVINQIVASDSKELTGFEAVLRELRIPLRSDRENGIAGGTMAFFLDTDIGTALLPTYVKASLAKFAEENPGTEGLIATRELTPNGSFLQPTLDLSAIDAGMRPVARGQELPEIKIGFSQLAAETKKFGAVIASPYETIRRVPISVVDVASRRIAVTANEAKFSNLIEIIYGAGTGVAKSTWNTADTVAGQIKYETWLNFTAKDQAGRRFNKVAGRLATLIAILTAPKPGVDPMMLSEVFAAARRETLGEQVAMRNKPWHNVELIASESVPANTLVAWDSNFAAGELLEIGSQISESGNLIRRQISEITISENLEHFILDADAIRIMTNI
jgi:hypothetical protein